MPSENRIAGYRIYIGDVPQNSVASAKMYNALIQLDAQFCLNKTNGSITLHYSQGSLSKIHENKVY